MAPRIVRGACPHDCPDTCAMHVTVEDGRAVAAAHVEHIGYLPQRVDGLDGTLTVFENIAHAAPHVPEKELRNRLARFLIRGATADRPVAERAILTAFSTASAPELNSTDRFSWSPGASALSRSATAT